MGLISTFKRSLARTRVARSASLLLMDGFGDEAFQTVKEFVNSDERLLLVLYHFRAMPQTLQSIFDGVRSYTDDEIAGGLAVAVSALLDAETLSYLLRAEQGDLDKSEAYEAVRQYFHTSSPGFKAERQYRIDNGL